MSSTDYLGLLRDTVIPFIKSKMKNDFILQHDGASIHRAGIINEYLAGSKITVLDWPSKSPDFNLVENA